jgi:hypothetical protein
MPSHQSWQVMGPAFCGEKQHFPAEYDKSSFSPTITYRFWKPALFANMSSSREDKAPLTDSEMGKGKQASFLFTTLSFLSNPLSTFLSTFKSLHGFLSPLPTLACVFK